MPIDASEPSTFCGGRFFAHAPAPGRSRTKLPGERRRTAHEIWPRRSGHFSMPATALHRSESYLSRPVAPFNAAGRALEGPTTRTRVPRPCLLFPRVHFYPSSELRIRKFSRTRAFGPSSDFGPPKSRVFHFALPHAAAFDIFFLYCRSRMQC